MEVSLVDLPYIDASLVMRYLDIEDPLVNNPADAIFVLGSGSLGPVHEAASLWHQRRAPVIAFTSAGGNFGGNIIFGQQEVDAYIERLLDLRVPKDCLLFPSKENRTTNTYMEAKVAIPFLRSNDVRAKSVILCSRAVHQRRAAATFQKQHPDVQYFNRPDGEPLTVELLPRLVQEVDRLQEYGKKGDIEMQVIPTDVLETVEKIRKHLKM